MVSKRLLIVVARFFPGLAKLQKFREPFRSKLLKIHTGGGFEASQKA